MAARIMVINHTRAVLDLFNDLLTGEGYQVFLGAFGPGDEQAVEHVMPDLLILDYVANFERSGWHLLQALHQRKATASIPVIICTTAVHLSLEIENYFVQKGISVIFKPFDIENLLATVQNALHGQVSIDSESVPI